MTTSDPIAPTASISIIAGNSSPGIEPIAANVFLQKTLSGSFTVRNRHLQKLLELKGQDNDAVWSSITTTKGSVQHLDFLTDDLLEPAVALERAEVVLIAVARKEAFEFRDAERLLVPEGIVGTPQFASLLTRPLTVHRW
jgi:ribonucleoside-diphosphate reductase alpha chain